MRYLFVLFISLGLLNAQELTPSQSARLQNYNHSLSGKLRHKRLMQSMVEVSREEAQKTAKESCKAKEIKTLKLSMHNKRLFYRIKTENCSIKIDALDGTVMEKK